MAANGHAADKGGPSVTNRSSFSTKTAIVFRELQLSAHPAPSPIRLHVSDRGRPPFVGCTTTAGRPSAADPNKIVLMGHSAGCHLVTLVRSGSSLPWPKVDLRPCPTCAESSPGAADRMTWFKRSTMAGALMPTTSKRPLALKKMPGVTPRRSLTLPMSKAGPPFPCSASVDPGKPSHQAANRLARPSSETLGGKATTKDLADRDHFWRRATSLGATRTTPRARSFLDFVHDCDTGSARAAILEFDLVSLGHLAANGPCVAPLNPTDRALGAVWRLPLPVLRPLRRAAPSPKLR